MSEREDELENTDGYDLAVAEARPKIKQPPLYRVVLINDDYTPMEFVVDILETVFAMERTTDGAPSVASIAEKLR